MDIGKLVVDFEELKLFNFPLDELFELQVNYKNIKYEFLARFASQNRNMICFGSGAINRKHFSLPLYNRHSWNGEFEESVIYYNDPTLYNNNEITLGWGIGKIEEWYLLSISHIIKILSNINEIKPENMLFFGSSGGGFTSVILAVMFKKFICDS